MLLQTKSVWVSPLDHLLAVLRHPKCDVRVLKTCGALLPGVIPIDRLTDVRAPTAVIAQRIHRQRLEEAYNVRLPKPSRDEAASRCAPS